MTLRLGLAALASTWLLGCALASGSRDTTGSLDDAGGASPEGSVTDDASGATGPSGPTGPTGSTGPGVFEAGPPAVIGGDAGDDGGGAEGGADSGCSTLAQCPYQSATNVAGVACTGGACVITCNGENYDVNGALADGCEIAGACVASQGKPVCPIDDHTQALAANAGRYPCADGSSAQNMTGAVPSDYRAHAPAIDNFSAATGATPDYFAIDATGAGLCQNDANLDLAMTSTTQPACYVLYMLTDKNGAGQSCNTDSKGHCSITNGSGSYSNGSKIYVSVSKNPSCAAASTPDDGVFQITGHL